MPRGYPDYFGQSIFPKYGGARRKSFYSVIVANTENDIVVVSGKGVIFGGWLYSNYGSKQEDDIIRIYVDEIESVYHTWLGLGRQNIANGNPTPVSISRYEPFEEKYCLIIGEGVTFDTQFKITYEETGGYTPTIQCELYYSLII